MRLNDKYLGFVINFLLGASWALVLIGALSSFLAYFHSSILLSIGAVFIGAIPGFIAVLFLENIITNKQKLNELRKQTLLLESIHETLSSKK